MTPLLTRRRIAVLGATGFIGSHLVERLVAEGADVLAISRTVGRLDRLRTVRGDCAIALCDLRDFDGLLRALQLFRPDTVYHLAAHPDGPESFAQFMQALEVNGVGLVNALHAAARSGAGLFVYGDSTKVYGNAGVPYRLSAPTSPLCSYAVMKAAGWQLCQLATACSGMQVSAVRPTFVYGPRQGTNLVSHVIACVAAGKPIRLQGGDQTRDPLYVDDAVEAFAAVPRHETAWGQAIPIGGGRELTVSAICDAVLAAIGMRVPVLANAEPPRATEVWRSTSDNADAHRLLDWQPRVSLATGLARTVASWADCPLPSSPFTPPARHPDVTPGRHFVVETAPHVRFAVLDRRDRHQGAPPAGGGRRSSDGALAAVGCGLLDAQHTGESVA
jgi:nucleoside-diphosphate-sugar epimerase